MPGKQILKKQPRFPFLNNLINKSTQAVGSKLMDMGKKMFGAVLPKSLPNVTAPAMPAAPSAIPAMPNVSAPVAGPQIPVATPVNPSAKKAKPALVNRNKSKTVFDSVSPILDRFKNGFKKDLQEEFDLNATRVNTPEDDMSFEKSKSLLPTVGRALKKMMPNFVDGLFEMITMFINAILDIFKAKPETKKMVTDMVTPLGKSLFSENPGQGLASMATAIAPSLVQALSSFLGVNITPEAFSAAAGFPASAYTPAAAAAAQNNGANNQAPVAAPAAAPMAAPVPTP